MSTSQNSDIAASESFESHILLKSKINEFLLYGPTNLNHRAVTKAADELLFAFHYLQAKPSLLSEKCKATSIEVHHLHQKFLDYMCLRATIRS